jgi:hypothetical protein
MAEYEYAKIQNLHKIFYILGTFQDIITHALNVYYLLQL